MTETHASLDLFGILWRLGATLFFVALNGFFVAAEFALVKVRESRIAKLVREGRGGAPTVQHILSHLDKYLSACQLGITLASLVLGALGEPAVSVLLLAAAEGAGFEIDPDASWLPILSIAIAFTIITMLHMTVGEQAPKMWALRRPETTALATGRTLWFFTLLFGPFITIINRVSNAMLRMVGLPADLGHESGHSAEEIRSILSLSAHAGHISELELELTENVFRMIELEVRHILVPRLDIVYLSLDKPLDENLERVRSSGHSRFALCESGLDSIVGIVHAKDVLGASLRGERPDLRAIAREPVFVSDTMALSDFLQQLQKKRQHCAVVVDEHGTTIGVAFREDALEEIVGPLGDEFDDDVPGVFEAGEGIFDVPGNMSLPELEDRLDFVLPNDEREEQGTVGGHVVARLGRLAREGDSVRVGPYRATVRSVSRRRVGRVRLELDDTDDDASEAGDEEPVTASASPPDPESSTA